MRFSRVGVLCGGISGEREVSLRSGRAVHGALARRGYDAVLIDVDREVDRRLREAEVEAVFIALHGRWGEDGTIQGLLEMIGLPYTGSPPLASALALDKPRAKDVLGAAGLPLARGRTFRRDRRPERLPDDLPLPVVVKPSTEGSSLGVSIVDEEHELASALDTAFAAAPEILVERYVKGAEVDVAVIDGEPVGAIEIEPLVSRFYDYRAKYEPGGSRHHLPPRIAPDRLAESLELARRAYLALGCAGAARVDFIIPETAPTIVLEVNTIPGMTEVSLLPEIAAAAGLPFDELCARLMDSARLHVV